MMNFTGGTSLMLKFERFPRFSEDLDFSMDYSERNNQKLLKMADRLVLETIEELQEKAMRSNIFVFDNEKTRRSLVIL